MATMTFHHPSLERKPESGCEDERRLDQVRRPFRAVFAAHHAAGEAGREADGRIVERVGKLPGDGRAPVVVAANHARHAEVRARQALSA